MLEKSTWQKLPKPPEGGAISFDITVRMQSQVDGEPKVLSLEESGFAICKNGQYYAYRNHCPHIGSPLDWLPDQFFSDDGENLLCHTHGALFDPATGDCLSGPCPRGLYPIPVQICDDHIQVPTTLNI